MADTPIVATRPTFHDRAFDRAREFAHEMLITTAEVESVIVVPVFATPNPSLPAAMIVGRNGPLRAPNEIVHAAAQMHLALRLLQEHALQILREADGQMAKLGEQIRAKRAELDQLNAELAQHRGEETASPAGGDPPRGPQPGWYPGG